MAEYTREQAQKIINEVIRTGAAATVPDKTTLAEQSGYEAGWRLMYLHLYLAARCNEILNIRRQDIDTDRWEVVILNNKTHLHEPRLIGIHPAIREHVQWFLDLDFTVWSHGRTVHITYDPDRPFRGCTSDTVSDWARVWFREAGIKRQKLHSLRHTFATWTGNESGVDIYAVKSYLGHSSVTVTEKYYVHKNKPRGAIIDI